MAAPHWIFAPFRLDLDNACVWRGAAQIALRPKTFAVLHYLVAHAGQLVTKDALLAAVWPETAVSDGVLKDCMYELRRALGDSAQAPQFIATVPRRGYRFLVPVAAHTEAVPHLWARHPAGCGVLSGVCHGRAKRALPPNHAAARPAGSASPSGRRAASRRPPAARGGAPPAHRAVL